MWLSGILLQSEHLCIYQKWHLHKFAGGGGGVSNVIYSHRLGACVWLLRFRSNNSRLYRFGLSIYVRELKQEPGIFSQQSDISVWYDIFSLTLSVPISGTDFHYLFTLIFFMFLFHYLTQSLIPLCFSRSENNQFRCDLAGHQQNHFFVLRLSE